MALYNHIVFATDLTEAAYKAADRAAEMARCFGGRLVFLNVVEHFPEDLPVEAIPPEDVDPETYLKKRSERRLRELAERLDGIPVEPRVAVTTGSAKQAILAYAREEHADLIIMGAVGHPGMLGTTVNGVTADAPCDVLVVQGATA